MRRDLARTGVGVITSLAALVLASACAGPAAEDTWTDTFDERTENFVSTGDNPFFVLQPGYQLVLEDGDEQLVITVLDETRTVDSVETRVVEERESAGGELVEVSRNFFAISAVTRSVYYFGEEVDVYEGGVVTRHEGAWQSGVAGARYGMIMPGLPLLGARYQQETAPGVAMDRARVVALDDTLTTPFGHFERVLVTEETTPLEPSANELKRYARGVGLIQDGDLRLVRHGRAPGRGPDAPVIPSPSTGPQAPVPPTRSDTTGRP